MSRNTNDSVRKLFRRIHIGLAALALILMVSTGFAAGPQPPSSQPPQSPIATCPPDGQCFADVPSSNPFYTFVNRIYQQDLVSGYACGGVGEPCDAYSRPYYRPVASVTRSQMAKFIDNARRLPQIHIETASSDPPIYVSNTVGSSVSGYSSSGYGVYGNSTDDIGVRGQSYNYTGVYGGTSGAASTDYGVWGSANAPAQAGHFSGNVSVIGTLSKGGGSFKIDHPLDPANKYLYHSFVESPDMKNIYDGVAVLDESGEAWVELPAWFDPLNRDFRYQLTPIGAPGRDLYIAQEIRDNRFKIAGGTPGLKVSWMVTGIREDPYANAHRIPVEEDKPANEKGKYLHPTEWGQPTSSGIDYEQQQQMQQMQQAQQPKP
jgi:hypothetical protein